MPKITKNILAVIAGIVLGSIVNMGVIAVGSMVIPPPEGVDLSDMDRFSENLMLLKPVNFIAPWLAHALGTLVGAFVAAKLAASHKMIFAFGMSLFFMFGGIAMIVMFGGPVWFAAADLLGAYLPMGYLGGKLGGGMIKEASVVAKS